MSCHGFRSSRIARLVSRLRAGVNFSPMGNDGTDLMVGAEFGDDWGAEFGAARNQLRNTQRGPVAGWNQFEPWRGSGPDTGYFLWPTIREEADRIVEAIDEALEPLWKRAFPEEG